jgi:polysaccharide pyruvyl transferase WcaK-like protein
MKILVGVVPYGRDNVGDEAILATIVSSVREAVPNAEITVSTDDEKRTGVKLEVRTAPLFGHDDPSYDKIQLEEEMRKADVFVWGGATGLSDYPHVALRMIKMAHRFGTKTVLYSVGMNDKLNGAFFTLRPGAKLTLFNFMSSLTLNNINFTDIYLRIKEKWMRNKIRGAVNKVHLVICRDRASKVELERCGVMKQIHHTADPAILLEPSNSIRLEQIWLENGLWSDTKPVVGICISAQHPVKKIDEIVGLADYLVDVHDSHILFIPMNPTTDSVLMEKIHTNMKHRSEASVLTGEFEPEDIAAIASRLSLVISSRLHLLILSAISYIPLVGLSRGSKVDTFVSLFGESTSGNVEQFDPHKLKDTCDRLLSDPDVFRHNAEVVVRKLQTQAAENIRLFREHICNLRGGE